MNIICFETEWLYNRHKKENRFNLNCQPILHCLKEYYGCDYIYRNVLKIDNLKYYMDYFNTKTFKKKYPLIYISTHGWNHSISLEGEDPKDPLVDLDELAQLSPHFFEGRLVHFSSCKTLQNPNAAYNFKEKSGATLVSGYQKEVDAMRSIILDMAYFDALQNYSASTLVKETSLFQRRYGSLMKDLKFIFV